MGHKEGHWVMLQNIHLMPSFLKDLEDKLAVYSVAGSHANFRLFLTSDPSKEIPIGLIERSIKLTNEPPAGMKANLLRAFGFFQPAEFDFQDNKLKTILFALSYFHAVMVERRKFGPKGWNAHYNFSIGDLRDSALVCQNYLDKSSQGGGKTPWDDLRYIFGDIMYGGYITDDIDREMCKTFLINMMNDQLFEEPELFPFVDKANVSFKCPNALSHDKYIEHINEELPPETPLAFGMHPNAEIDFRTTQCKALFTMLVELAPKGAAGGDENAPTPLSRFEAFEDRVSNECNLESNKPNVEDIRSKLGDDPENEMKPY
jgi:dynein heavy chain